MFSVTGAQIAERAGAATARRYCPWNGDRDPAGGVVRDILSAEIPLVLRRGNLYASAAISGTAIYFILVSLGAARGVATWAGMIVVASVRVASIIWGLKLPVFVLEGDSVSGGTDRTSKSEYS